MKLTDINLISISQKSVSKGNEKSAKSGSHFATMQEAFGEPGENPESLELVEPLLF